MRGDKERRTHKHLIFHFDSQVVTTWDFFIRTAHKLKPILKQLCLFLRIFTLQNFKL